MTTKCVKSTAVCDIQTKQLQRIKCYTNYIFKTLWLKLKKASSFPFLFIYFLINKPILLQMIAKRAESCAFLTYRLKLQGWITKQQLWFTFKLQIVISNAFDCYKKRKNQVVVYIIGFLDYIRKIQWSI